MSLRAADTCADWIRLGVWRANYVGASLTIIGQYVMFC